MGGKTRGRALALGRGDGKEIETELDGECRRLKACLDVRDCWGNATPSAIESCKSVTRPMTDWLGRQATDTEAGRLSLRRVRQEMSVVLMHWSIRSGQPDVELPGPAARLLPSPLWSALGSLETGTVDGGRPHLWPMLLHVCFVAGGREAGWQGRQHAASSCANAA